MSMLIERGGDMLVDAEKLVRLGCKNCKNTRWFILEPREENNLTIYVCDKCGRAVKVTALSRKEPIPTTFNVEEIKTRRYIV